MARTKQTARKSTGGRAPRQMLACHSAQQFRSYMTSQQSASYATASSSAPATKTSYLNYENMFYSYYFDTGPLSKKRFEARFKTGAGKNPTTSEEERWLGMSFNSMFDGKGMKTHGRPNLNVVIVLDVSGSMGMSFSNDGGRFKSKLEVAKECLMALVDQLKPNDSFGLVRFNHAATVHHQLTKWKNVKKYVLRSGINSLIASGSTCLTAAIDQAIHLFNGVVEEQNSTNRIIFLTDLCSTVDSVNDEKNLLATIQANAGRGIFTSVVGLGMDLNIRLVEDISKTRGAKYLSVDNPDEFKTIMNQDFDYDVTVTAFNIRVTLLNKEYELLKGYGSPEVNNLKPGKPIVISSEFPSWQNDRGESKGGILLFKFAKSKSTKTSPTKLKVEVKYEDSEGVVHCEVINVPIQNKFEDSSVRKAALLVHYVDLHNDYVLDARKSKAKFLELFQSFRDHFTSELEEMKDKSLATYNKGDLELIDKIIELEGDPSQSKSSTSAQSSSMFQTGGFFSQSSGTIPGPFQTGGFFSCAPSGGWRPATKVGGVRKTTAAAGRKKCPARKTTKGVAKNSKSKSVSLPSSKASVANNTQSVTGRRSRKRVSTPDNSQIPNAKKPRKATTRSSTRSTSKPIGGKSKGKSVTTRSTPVTKAAAPKAAAAPKKPKPTARARESKGSTRVQVQKITSVSTRRSSRRTK